MREFIPSFQVYREIIRDIQKTGKACGYEEALSRDVFIIMRYDIEFSIDRAFRLSQLESGMDFSSTYFVQITNNSYNPFSRKICSSCGRWRTMDTPLDCTTTWTDSGMPCR